MLLMPRGDSAVSVFPAVRSSASTRLSRHIHLQVGRATVRRILDQDSGWFCLRAIWGVFAFWALVVPLVLAALLAIVLPSSVFGRRRASSIFAYHRWTSGLRELSRGFRGRAIAGG